MFQRNQSAKYPFTFFGKIFDLFDLFLGLIKSIELIQSYQPLKVNRLNHLLYENELAQSPINLLGKGTESIQSILRKNESMQINELKRVDWYLSLLLMPHSIAECRKRWRLSITKTPRTMMRGVGGRIAASR